MNGDKQMIQKAAVFAAKAHEGMMRKGSRIPYIYHPMEVALIVAQMTYNNMAIDEIADAMDCSRSTIKRRLHKGQKLLEARLGKEKGGISFV